MKLLMENWRGYILKMFGAMVSPKSSAQDFTMSPMPGFPTQKREVKVSGKKSIKHLLIRQLNIRNLMEGYS